MANKNLFTQVEQPRIDKNVFDLTHDMKLSAQMGKLYPVLSMECVPGDRFTLGTDSLIRFAPLVAPVMHRMDATFHYFFVPNRLTWPNWEKFITGDNLQGPGGPTLTPVPPFLVMDTADTAVGTLPNYMGVPALTAPNIINVSALPFAAYQMIYNEYYRDQNLIQEVPFELIDGDNQIRQAQLQEIRKRAWEHDYFTSALPWAQKGDAVLMPTDLKDVRVKVNTGGGASPGATWDNQFPLSAFPSTSVDGGTPDVVTPIIPVGTLYADMDSSSAEVTINDLRRATALQRWLEKNARAGTRYIESIKAHFQVNSSDKRLQRPEYITGVKTPVIVSEVLNSTGETSGLPQGNMAGHALSVTHGKNGSYFCEEHGYIICIMSVLPKTAYQQGLPKHFFKFDKLDYFWPTFANLGEQEVLCKEIYADQLNTDQEAIFGYTPRYSEYKYMPGRVAGQFQTTLNYWHEGRIFATPPLLNQTFIEADPSQRIFAVTNPLDDYLFVQVLHRIKAVRPMPFYGTPGGL